MAPACDKPLLVMICAPTAERPASRRGSGSESRERREDGADDHPLGTPQTWSLCWGSFGGSTVSLRRSHIRTTLPCADKLRTAPVQIVTLVILPPLPLPPDEWLVAFNDECRKKEIAAGERPFRALERWADENGQKTTRFQLLLSHLATPAFNAIYAFFKANTSLGRDDFAPFRQTCFFYDTAFWPVIVPVIFGHGVVDPIRFVVGMPSAVFSNLGFNSTARDELDAHWFDCEHHMNHHALIESDTLPELARDFLAGGEKGLFAAAESLLAIRPNQKAAELSRDAFESTLKGFAVVKSGLSAERARKKISHDLYLLVQECAGVLPAAERIRFENACSIYPSVGARYEKSAQAMQRLWECYREAQHAMAISLRIIGGEMIP